MNVSVLKKVLVFLCLFSLAAGMHAQEERPNIVLIFMDDLGHNDIGLNAYPSPDNPYPGDGPAPMITGAFTPEPNEALNLTPAIDRLAAEGIHMTNFYATSICTPSRAMLMSGRYARRSNLYRVFSPGSNDGFSTEETTLPEKLREVGYRTSMVGKWHLGYNQNARLPYQMMPTRHGFEDFYGLPYSNNMRPYPLIEDETIIDPDVYPAEKQAELTWKLTERALERIETHSQGEDPFFLFFSHPMTHIPCWPSDREFANADGTTWPKFQGQSGVSYYYDVVMEVNHSTQRVLDKLDELGIADDTLVIFASDNGPWVFIGDKRNWTEYSVGSAYPFRGAKMQTWEGGVRVPLIARWPGKIPAGRVNHSIGGLSDFLPTLVGLTGGELPQDRIIDGIDLWPIWSGQVDSIDRSFAFSESFNDGWASIRRGDWKLREGKLYNLANDIQEKNDLSGDAQHSATLQSLQTEMQDLIQSAQVDNVPLGTYNRFEVEFDRDTIVIPKGGGAAVQLRLTHNPGQNVSVQIEHFSGNSDIAVAEGAALSFNTDNWDVWQTVVFSAASDEDARDIGTTFRITMDAHPIVRELFVFKEAGAPVRGNLVWPKSGKVWLTDPNQAMLLEASTQYDGRRNSGDLDVSWSQASGPAGVVFSSPTERESSVRFPADGAYQLGFRADHPEARSAKVIEFEVNVGPESDDFQVPQFAPALAYPANPDLRGSRRLPNQVNPGSYDLRLDRNIALEATLPSDDDTLSEFGMNGDINGTASGGSSSGISGNQPSNWAFGSASTFSPNLSLITGGSSIGIEAGSGIDVPAGGNQQTNDFSYAGHGGNTLTEAISADDYISVQVEIAEGYELRLEGYAFDVWRNGGQAVENYALFHGTPGFSAAPGSESTTASIPGSGTGALTKVNSGVLFAIYTGIVEFRLYGWQAAGNTAAGNTHFDAARVIGEIVPVGTPLPEPDPLEFGMDGDINGTAFGGESSGISGNQASNWAFGGASILNPNLSLITGSSGIGIQAAPGINVPAGLNQQSNDFSYAGHGASSLAGAISDDDYIYFQVGIAEGYELRLESYTLDVWRNGAAAAENYALFHGAPGFSAAPGSESASSSIPGSGTGALTEVRSGLLNDVYTGNVEFRLYGWQAGGNTAAGNTHFDAARLAGEIVPVGTPLPEPAFPDLSWHFPGGNMQGAATESLVDFAEDDASFEIWFKPETLPTATPQVIWEAGGNVGVSFIIDGNQLKFVIDDGPENLALGAVTGATITPSPEHNGFIHAVGIIDLGEARAELYLNGALAATSPLPDLSRWSDGGGMALGKIDAAPDFSDGSAFFDQLGGNDLLTPPIRAYAGQIARARFDFRALAASQVAALYADPLATEVGNQAPTVSAGADQTLSVSKTATLNGSAADDHSAQNPLHLLWTQAGGPDADSNFPAQLVFATPTSATTAIQSSVAGRYTARLQADDRDVLVFDEVQISLEPLTFAEWAVETQALPVGASGADDDPDKDGVSNLLEWAIGTSPLLPNTAAPLNFNFLNAAAAIQFKLHFDAPRDRVPSVTLQASSDLVQWDPLPAVVPSVKILDAETQRWSLEHTSNPLVDPRLFYRLVLNQTSIE